MLCKPFVFTLAAIAAFALNHLDSNDAKGDVVVSVFAPSAFSNAFITNGTLENDAFESPDLDGILSFEISGVDLTSLGAGSDESFTVDLTPTSTNPQTLFSGGTGPGPAGPLEVISGPDTSRAFDPGDGDLTLSLSARDFSFSQSQLGVDLDFVDLNLSSFGITQVNGQNVPEAATITADNLSLSASNGFNGISGNSQDSLSISIDNPSTAFFISGANFTATVSSATAVPEPSSLALLGITSLTLVLRRRR